MSQQSVKSSDGNNHLLSNWKVAAGEMNRQYLAIDKALEVSLKFSQLKDQFFTNNWFVGAAQWTGICEQESGFGPVAGWFGRDQLPLCDSASLSAWGIDHEWNQQARPEVKNRSVGDSQRNCLIY